MDNYGCTPLHLAANDGYLEIFKFLIENFDDLNSYTNGKTPIYFANESLITQTCTNQELLSLLV